jgi:dTDP-4-dehydrorhamnose 3,5-epimerase
MSENIGVQDPQSVKRDGSRASAPNIAGVRIVELANILTRSGWMAEIFRADWPQIEIGVQQVNWVELRPNGVTDWHRHVHQTDHLVGVGGAIKLALYDARADSSTPRATDVIRMGAIRPVMVIVPPGVWHALRNESGAPAGYLNITNKLYRHECPDNWRLAPDEIEIANLL